MTITTIRNSDRLSNTTYHRRCTSSGQRHWWLRRDGGEFIRLPQLVRGDYDIEVTLDLEPGRYVLGTGPVRKFGVREIIEVSA